MKRKTAKQSSKSRSNIQENKKNVNSKLKKQHTVQSVSFYNEEDKKVQYFYSIDL